MQNNWGNSMATGKNSTLILYLTTAKSGPVQYRLTRRLNQLQLLLVLFHFNCLLIYESRILEFSLNNLIFVKSFTQLQHLHESRLNLFRLINRTLE